MEPDGQKDQSDGEKGEDGEDEKKSESEEEKEGDDGFHRGKLESDFDVDLTFWKPIKRIHVNHSSLSGPDSQNP